MKNYVDKKQDILYNVFMIKLMSFKLLYTMEEQKNGGC